jgi:AraC family transcriptional regulator
MAAISYFSAYHFDRIFTAVMDKCRYEASRAINHKTNIQSPFTASEITKSKYAVLYYKGPLEEAINAQLGIYNH